MKILLVAICLTFITIGCVKKHRLSKNHITLIPYKKGERIILVSDNKMRDTFTVANYESYFSTARNSNMVRSKIEHINLIVKNSYDKNEYFLVGLTARENGVIVLSFNINKFRGGEYFRSSILLDSLYLNKCMSCKAIFSSNEDIYEIQNAYYLANSSTSTNSNIKSILWSISKGLVGIVTEKEIWKLSAY